ncbi:hypothetical protein GQ44DRAFT_602345 [Phaeosphaeriaceae sp. PMI808]|nr:hypothetical protein GQ44DRAFT_602345 [Phaeosphaeriaceae sp. PMI808]
MGIDSDRSPSIKNGTSQTHFVDEYATLPASGPTDHAHIINLNEYSYITKDDELVKLQDAIVTTLYNVSPGTLKSFLSPTVNTFKCVFGKKDMQLVIWRKGLEVFVGTYEHHTSLKIFHFEHVAGFLIGYDGSWHLKVTASGACSNTKWPEVWAGKFESYPGVATMFVDVEDVPMARRASALAESILSNSFWELKSDAKTT